MALSFPKLEILRRSFPLLFEVKNQKNLQIPSLIELHINLLYRSNKIKYILELFTIL